MHYNEQLLWTAPAERALSLLITHRSPRRSVTVVAAVGLADELAAAAVVLVLNR